MSAPVYAPVSHVWERVLARTTVTDACWLWNGALNSRGYGSVSSGRKGRTVLVHRVAVLADGRDLPEGMTVDHTCQQKRCVNPAHLDVVTGPENTRRWAATITHCAFGHPLEWQPSGRQRHCRTCKNAYQRARRARLRAQPLRAAS